MTTGRSETVLLDDGSPFHAGEKAVQARVGVREVAERVGRAITRDHMPAQHRELFEKLPYLVLGAVDDRRRPWASFLANAPGFIEAKNANTLVVHARPLPGDALRERLAPGAQVGVLGIELHTRRRNRANGSVLARAEEAFALHIAQSFGNCPKHITPRLPRALPKLAQAAPAAFDEGPLLSEQARRQIAASDTFFIASSARATPVADPREGLDVSHRGGHTGFVTVVQTAEQSVLSFLDYSGNNVFNTLGNILQNPVVGLTFVDFDRGDVLMLTGRASVDFAPTEAERQEGGERKVTVAIEEGRRLERALPFGFIAV